MSESEKQAKVEDLEDKVREVRSTLNVLEAQLAQAREASQHEAVDHLEDYLEDSEIHLRDLHELETEVVDEFHDLVERVRRFIREHLHLS